jgi:hypothetical protein
MERCLIDKLFFTRWYRYWLVWQDFCSTLTVLQQRQYLEQLTAWAKRKRLKIPFNHYKNLLRDVEDRLFWKRVRSRHLSFCAGICFEIIQTLYPSPQPKKGWAVQYRLRNS